MKIKEIYEKFDKIGCLSFATLNEENEIESRIAHLRGYDDDGIYFMTMYTKSFYHHLINNNKVAISGLCAKTQASHDESGLPLFENGYAIRLSGRVNLVNYDDLRAKNNPIFDLCFKDYEKYPAMVVFCINQGYGDIFDYDFELENREHKLERTYFSYNTHERLRGLKINPEACISCGICHKKCSFSAINYNNNLYSINVNRCDECGDCYISCPVKAISYAK